MHHRLRRPTAADRSRAGLACAAGSRTDRGRGQPPAHAHARLILSGVTRKGRPRSPLFASGPSAYRWPVVFPDPLKPSASDEIVSVPPPEFVSVTDFAALVLPTPTVPNASELTLIAAAAGDGVPT